MVSRLIMIGVVTLWTTALCAYLVMVPESTRISMDWIVLTPMLLLLSGGIVWMYSWAAKRKAFWFLFACFVLSEFAVANTAHSITVGLAYRYGYENGLLLMLMIACGWFLCLCVFFVAATILLKPKTSESNQVVNRLLAITRELKL